MRWPKIYHRFERFTYYKPPAMPEVADFADATAGIKALVERCGMVSTANGGLLKRKVGAAVAAMRRAGAVHAFDTLNHLFQHQQMVVVGSSCWNVDIGRDPGQVKDDAEGLQTMETLGKNMAWLLKKTTAKQGMPGKRPTGPLPDDLPL